MYSYVYMNFFSNISEKKKLKLVSLSIIYNLMNSLLKTLINYALKDQYLHFIIMF